MDNDRECLVEVEGLTYYGKHLGRHQTKKGFEADCEKYNSAAILGYTVFRFTENQIANGMMEVFLKRFFKL